MGWMSSARRAAGTNKKVASGMARAEMSKSRAAGRKYGRAGMLGGIGVVGVSSGAYGIHRRRTQAGLVSNPRGMYGH